MNKHYFLILLIFFTETAITEIKGQDIPSDQIKAQEESIKLLYAQQRKDGIAMLKHGLAFLAGFFWLGEQQLKYGHPLRFPEDMALMAIGGITLYTLCKAYHHCFEGFGCGIEIHLIEKALKNSANTSV